MASLIYFLCAITALACAVLVLRSYRNTRHRLLFWCGLCFAGMFAANLLLIIDRLVMPDTDLSTVRLIVGLIALLPLLYGLVWEDE
ncbi:hypothetical protein GTP41_18345 [Pseudoduganella sp. DS3]|uniref:Uncharacterized protein n=1 Tax=Pseudoduganella guangdongensis TaxID=2692179 RepID=A0A6N9HMY0_9BURK|nr:DUF5985 family protein [Pseudoduganella guangdongensis]MYN04055.1 hypothetical protein [Pseudoduganella guangdongensis]